MFTTAITTWNVDQPLAEWNECALSTSHQRRIRGNWTMRMHFHSSVLQVIQLFWCVLAAGGDSVRLVWPSRCLERGQSVQSQLESGCFLQAIDWGNFMSFDFARSILRKL